MTSTPDKIPQAVVIGGGITGLACALRLLELGREKNFPVQVLLIESSGKLGGVISTLRQDGCVLELGPDAIFTEKSWGLDFLKKLGLEKAVVDTNPGFRKSFVATRGKLYPVPEGFYLLAPSRIFPLIFSPIFSVRGKLRALCDLFIPAKAEDGDESLESFVLRRLGKEVLERMAQPMVGGVYSSDLKDMSLKATFPRFLELERDYGSVIRGLASGRKVSGAGPVRGPRYSLFVSLERGLERLVEKAREKIGEERIRFQTETEAVYAEQGRFKIRCEGFEVEADALCLACPAHRSSKILDSLDGGLAGNLAQIPYRSGATVNLVYKKEDIPRPLDGFGFVVPEIEKSFISGCTFSSVKFLKRAPVGRVVLRAFAGGRSRAEFLGLSDGEIETKARADLKKFLGVSAAPLFSVVRRYPDSLPQYRVGHPELVKKIENRLRNFRGLALAGNYFYGTGIPDCVRSGELAAEKMMGDLMNR